MANYQDFIVRYGMQPHPEGGFYAETYRSKLEVFVPVKDGQGDEIMIKRPASTSILFLLTPGNVSRLHRIKSDELWHFYQGDSLTVVELSEDGAVSTVLGDDASKGHVLQHCVKGGTWFGSFTNSSDGYSLAGCTVAPGFTFNDFELGSRSILLKKYPMICPTVIEMLTIGLP